MAKLTKEKLRKHLGNPENSAFVQELIKLKDYKALEDFARKWGISVAEIQDLYLFEEVFKDRLEMWNPPQEVDPEILSYDDMTDEQRQAELAAMSAEAEANVSDEDLANFIQNNSESATNLSNTETNAIDNFINREKAYEATPSTSSMTYGNTGGNLYGQDPIELPFNRDPSTFKKNYSHPTSGSVNSLKHFADIERRSGVGTDDWGNPLPTDDWGNNHFETLRDREIARLNDLQFYSGGDKKVANSINNNTNSSIGDDINPNTGMEWGKATQLQREASAGDYKGPFKDAVDFISDTSEDVVDYFKNTSWEGMKDDFLDAGSDVAVWAKENPWEAASYGLMFIPGVGWVAGTALKTAIGASKIVLSPLAKVAVGATKSIKNIPSNIIKLGGQSKNVKLANGKVVIRGGREHTKAINAIKKAEKEANKIANKVLKKIKPTNTNNKLLNYKNAQANAKIANNASDKAKASVDALLNGKTKKQFLKTASKRDIAKYNRLAAQRDAVYAEATIINAAKAAAEKATLNVGFKEGLANAANTIANKASTIGTGGVVVTTTAKELQENESSLAGDVYRNVKEKFEENKAKHKLNTDTRNAIDAAVLQQNNLEELRNNNNNNNNKPIDSVNTSISNYTNKAKKIEPYSIDKSNYNIPLNQPIDMTTLSNYIGRPENLPPAYAPPKNVKPNYGEMPGFKRPTDENGRITGNYWSADIQSPYWQTDAGIDTAKKHWKERPSWVKKPTKKEVDLDALSNWFKSTFG